MPSFLTLLLQQPQLLTTHYSLVASTHAEFKVEVLDVGLDRSQGDEQPRRDLTTDSREADPAVSTDGRHVAFASDRDGDFEIYVANVFTGELEQVTENMVADRQPTWSADGR